MRAVLRTRHPTPGYSDQPSGLCLAEEYSNDPLLISTDLCHRGVKQGAVVCPGPHSKSVAESGLETRNLKCLIETWCFPSSV